MANPIGIFLREPWIEEITSLKEIMERLCSIGFSYFELPQKHYFSEKEINLLKNLKKEKGLSYSLHSSSPCGLINITNPNYANFEPRTKQLFDFAKEIGVYLINFDFDLCYLAEISLKRDPHLVWKRIYKTLVLRIKTLLNYGEKYKTLVVFENADVRDPQLLESLRFGMKAEDFLLLQKEIPKLRLTLDIGHLFLCSKWFQFDLFDDFLNPLFPLISHLHLSSNFGKETGLGIVDYKRKLGDLHLSLQLGTLPWKKIVSFLLKKGFKGSFILEIKPEEYKDSLEEILEEIETSYKLLKREIV